ncbi:syndecan [Adelges cooleyi]|uniref:syndecan n=1 Tax=Adelges cooleyi TaxID=133065 RepID=UPI00217FB6B9|nr:syndecan [Adelges cooleyi]
MQPTILCLALVCATLVPTVLAESSKNVSSNPIPLKSDKDDLFIDDPSEHGEDTDTDKIEADDMMLGEEGSGNGPAPKGTGAEDMESSGSGYGPDDEDAQVGNKGKGKAGPDAEDEDEEEDEDDKEDEDEDEDIDVPDDKISVHKSNPTTSSTSTTTTTTTTTTTEDPNSEEEESRILINKPKPKSNYDTVEQPSIPEVPQTSTSTSTLPPPPSNGIDEHSSNGVYISPNSHPERTTSFFAQPGILAAVIGGAVVGLLCAILVVMFIVYRMRKKDEGSYPLEETKRSPATNPYLKSTHREFYA